MFRIHRFKITARHSAAAVAVAASIFFSFSQVRNENHRQERDLEISSVLLADSLREAAELMLSQGLADRLKLLVERFGRRGRLAGLAVFDQRGRIVAGTKSLLPQLRRPPTAVAACLDGQTETAAYESVGASKMRVTALPLHVRHGARGVLAVFHDMDFIEARTLRTSLTNAQRLAIQAALFLLATWLFGLFFKEPRV